MDLVDTVIHLNRRGESESLERFNEWLKESENIQTSEFIVENEKYYWGTISSIEFHDIIDDDVTDWFLIYSERMEFKAIAKRRNYNENLIGEKAEFYITTLWILKSNIESLKVEKLPINIWTPHHFNSPLNRINYDFKQLILKLKDPKIKITQFVSLNAFKSLTKRIR